MFNAYKMFRFSDTVQQRFPEHDGILRNAFELRPPSNFRSSPESLSYFSLSPIASRGNQYKTSIFTYLIGLDQSRLEEEQFHPVGVVKAIEKGAIMINRTSLQQIS